MARIVGSEQQLTLMVNCKTYPAVSRKYIETVCTGGVQDSGQFVRLYPVQYRFLDEAQRYDRWDVIRVNAYKDTKDTRLESWHLVPGTPITVVEKISTPMRRWQWMRSTVYPSVGVMQERNVTNGCVEIEPLEFYYLPARKDWTPTQRATIRQNDLFATRSQLRGIAERIPWEFRLKYRERETGRLDDGKVLAWSYYQGFRKFSKTNSEQVALEMLAAKVRSTIFLKTNTVFAILGTHSRFGHWMISSIYSVPTGVITKDKQKGGSLF